MKALFVAANPLDTSRLALDEEMRSIMDKVGRTPSRDEVEFVSAWAARPDDLLHAVNQHRPAIIHFAGHGGPTSIAMAGHHNRSVLVPDAALVSLFKIASEANLKVVLLNSCYSLEIAKKVTAVVPCVIGSQTALGDAQAAAFSSSFYRALCFGTTVKEAVDQGRTSILLEGLTGADEIRLLGWGDDLVLMPLVGLRNRVRRDGSPRAGAPAPGESTEVPLFNEAECADYVADSIRWASAAALTYLDVDGLLAINTVYGQHIGDLVLKRCGELIQENYAGSGVVCRLRGDQFVVAEAEADAEEVAQRAREVLHRIHGHDWSAVHPDLHVSVTASTAYRHPREDAPSLILRAILGVKEAKRRGPGTFGRAPIALPQLNGDPHERWSARLRQMPTYLSS